MFAQKGNSKLIQSLDILKISILPALESYKAELDALIALKSKEYKDPPTIFTVKLFKQNKYLIKIRNRIEKFVEQAKQYNFFKEYQDCDYSHYLLKMGNDMSLKDRIPLEDLTEPRVYIVSNAQSSNKLTVSVVRSSNQETVIESIDITLEPDNVRQLAIELESLDFEKEVDLARSAEIISMIQDALYNGPLCDRKSLSQTFKGLLSYEPLEDNVSVVFTQCGAVYESPFDGGEKSKTARLLMKIDEYLSKQSVLPSAINLGQQNSPRSSA